MIREPTESLSFTSADPESFSMRNNDLTIALEVLEAIFLYAKIFTTSVFLQID